MADIFKINTPYFGWGLLLETIRNNLKCTPDFVVAFVHWQLVKLGFLCLGTGGEVGSRFVISALNFHLTFSTFCPTEMFATQ